MKTVKVEFEVKVPNDMTEEQVFEWVSFNIGTNGGCSLQNPLADTDLEAEFGSVYISEL